MNQNLLILGAGQFGWMTKELAVSMNCFDNVDFLDDNSELAIGKLADYQRLAIKYSYAIVAIGNPELRFSWLQKLEDAGYRIAVLVAPSAYVAPSAQIMKGSIVEPNATVQSNTTVAAGCIISSGAVIRHNAAVGDCCHVDCNAVVLSGVTVPPKTKVPPLACYTADSERTN